MIATSKALLGELQSRGLAAADTHAVDADARSTHDRPWYIGLLLGVSGWLAGLFLIGFVALLFRFDGALQAGIAGVILLAAAWGLFYAGRDGAGAPEGFVTQLALALSIAGQVLLLIAINEHTGRTLGRVAASALLLQSVLALVMPNRLQRTLSTFFATVAWALTVRVTVFGEADFWHPGGGAAVSIGQSLGVWLLAWLPIGAAVAMLLRSEPGWMARGWQPVVRPLLTGAIVGLAFATVVSHPWESFWWLGAAPAQRNWLALWPMPAALAALGGIAAAFALRSQALMGACALGALLHVSHFYYELGASLLLKSLLMLAMGGVALLVARGLGAGGLGAGGLADRGLADRGLGVGGLADPEVAAHRLADSEAAGRGLGRGARR